VAISSILLRRVATPLTRCSIPDLGRCRVGNGRVGSCVAFSSPVRVGALLRAIDSYEGSFITRCALRLAPLVFVRPGELRMAEWTEFNLAESEWRIPAARMKNEVSSLRSPRNLVCRDSAGDSFTDRHRAIRFPRRARPQSADEQ
jgi:hypothetical protein